MAVAEPHVPTRAAGAAAEVEQGTSLWQDAWLRLRHNKLAMASLVAVLLILATCFVVPLFIDLDPNAQRLDNKFAGPSAEHWLGTDQLGRDLLHRIIEGGQISLLVAFFATFLTGIIGILYGGISGYVGGKLDSVMMRIVDGLLAMPFLIIVILFRELIKVPVEKLSDWLIADVGLSTDLVLRFGNIAPLIVAIAAFGWLTMARIVRTQSASLVELEYIEAARSLGIGHARILLRHILPNALGPIIIYATLTVPSFILYEATLSFLGLGIEPPHASWGSLIKEGANFLETRPALILIPGLVFSGTLFALNFLGDGLRDALDPKSSKD